MRNGAGGRSQGPRACGFTRLFPALGLAAAVGCAGPTGPGKGAAPAPLPDGAWVLDGVRVWDAAGPREDRALIIVGDAIVDERAAGGTYPAAVEVRAGDGATVLPGLIDAHVHLTLAGSLGWVGSTVEANLLAYPAWGVVAVADFGSGSAGPALAARVASGALRGPRVWSTGPMITAVGSHPCEALNDREICRFVEDGVGAALAAGGAAPGAKVVLADAAFTPWPTPRLDLGDLAALVDAAHADGRRVAVHVDTLDDAQDAAAAGADLLAHPPFDAALPAAAGFPPLPVTSTLSAFDGVGAVLDGSLLGDDLRATPAAVRADWAAVAADPSLLLPGFAAESAGWAAAAAGSVAVLHAAGHPVLAGSDGGYRFVPHGLGLHRELEALVATAGLTPAEALTAATALPAAVFGWSDLGFIGPGAAASFVLVDGRPDEDLADLRRIRAVYLDGVPWDGPASAVVQAAGAGGACVRADDCPADAACDALSLRCVPRCDTLWALDDPTCGPAGACQPADGIAGPPALCRPVPTCATPGAACAPDYYGETCVPIDTDTARCWPVGPAAEGEACSWTDPAAFCGPGATCDFWLGVCVALCDPSAPSACPGRACQRTGPRFYDACWPVAAG